MQVSPDNSLLAYAADVVGAENYGLWIRDLTSGRELLARLDAVSPAALLPSVLALTAAAACDAADLLYLQALQSGCVPVKPHCFDIFARLCSSCAAPWSRPATAGRFPMCSTSRAPCEPSSCGGTCKRFL